jgi:hypothetical protein
LLPTLVQAITSVYAGWPDLASGDLPTNDGDLFASLAAGPVPVIPSHPDFSKIRIRRPGDDGKESITEVDLTSVIASCTDATPSAEAAKADILLRAGDIVELPLQQNRLDQPWTGFSPAEARLFHKALAGSVLVTRGTGKIERLEIDYQPPAWRATGHGLLPLPPAQGTSSLLTDRVVPGAVFLRRGETTAQVTGLNNGAQFFLRDGDQISAPAAPVSVPGQRNRVMPPQQSQQPQPMRPARR